MVCRSWSAPATIWTRVRRLGQGTAHFSGARYPRGPMARVRGAYCSPSRVKDRMRLRRSPLLRDNSLSSRPGDRLVMTDLPIRCRPALDSSADSVLSPPNRVLHQGTVVDFLLELHNM